MRHYAPLAGVTEDQFRARLGAPVTPRGAGGAFLTLAAGELDETVSYLLTGEDGLTALRPQKGGQQ